ncbi:MAG TPA: hypothetical protein VMN57_12405 [Anaerolineales bacterium]|nr:hypothetical protein [Anaerolineales bacterium]
MGAFNRLLDRLSEFFSKRKGFLPFLGILLVVLNFFLGAFGAGWLAESDLLLHAGVVVAIFGFLLAWAL